MPNLESATNSLHRHSKTCSVSQRQEARSFFLQRKIRSNFIWMRTHYQALLWKNAHLPALDLPPPTSMGWAGDENKPGLRPVLMSLNLILSSCLEIISCGWHKFWRTMRCKCRKAKLRCTALCDCRRNIDDEHGCLNTDD